jgi:hypothetical protein
MSEKEEYEILKNKIIKLIEEKYLKSFYKEVKKFQIVMAGYNASEQKDLQVFEEYGWKLSSPIIGCGWMNCLFKYKISSKCGIYINLAKNLKTGILESDPNMTWGAYMKIYVEQTDEIFRFINLIEKLGRYDSIFCLENGSLKIVINCMIDVEYMLTISDSQS